MISSNPSKYKLFHEDCARFIKRMPNKSVDLILTDPPYNISESATPNIHLPSGKTIHNRIATWDLKNLNIPFLTREFRRIIKPSGNIFIFTSYKQFGKWHEELDKSFQRIQLFVWHKTTPTESVYKNSFLNSCELIICAWDKKHSWNFHSQRQMHNHFECQSCRGVERLSSPRHPTQKPLALIEHLITIASNRDDIVFDPFSGVGTTAVAAIKYDRRFIGCEIDKKYCAAMEQRIQGYL